MLTGASAVIVMLVLAGVVKLPPSPVSLAANVTVSVASSVKSATTTLPLVSILKDVPLLSSCSV